MGASRSVLDTDLRQTPSNSTAEPPGPVFAGGRSWTGREHKGLSRQLLPRVCFWGLRSWGLALAGTALVLGPRALPCPHTPAPRSIVVELLWSIPEHVPSGRAELKCLSGTGHVLTAAAFWGTDERTPPGPGFRLSGFAVVLLQGGHHNLGA